jgi:heat shock protein HslJ
MTLASCSPRYSKSFPPVAPLLGTWWRAVEVDGRRPDFIAGQKMDIFVTLSRQGRLKGSGGCNHIDATFVRSGTNVRFGSISSTRIFCSPEVMARERTFINALRKTVSFALDGRELRFYDRTGHEVLSFMAARRP